MRLQGWPPKLAQNVADATFGPKLEEGVGQLPPPPQIKCLAWISPSSIIFNENSVKIWSFICNLLVHTMTTIQNYRQK